MRHRHFAGVIFIVLVMSVTGCKGADKQVSPTLVTQNQSNGANAVRVARVKASSANKVESLYQIAQSKQKNYRKSFMEWEKNLNLQPHLSGVAIAQELNADNSLKAAKHEYQIARRQALEAVSQRWAGLELSSLSTQPLVISEPLLLAMEHLQVELTHILGKSLKTEVKGLLQYSKKDILKDELLMKYAEAVMEAEVDDMPHPTAEPLSDLARELALLSARQMNDLDHALAEASATVIAQIEAGNAGVIVPKVVWLLAPIEVLVFDISKHRGDRSASTSWFAEHKGVLSAEVKRNGWPSGALYLYNRLTGTLDGFFLVKNEKTARQNSPANTRFVDPITFLDTLTDPRAIGLGNCGLAGMVRLGPVVIGSSTELLSQPTVAGFPHKAVRYACPSFACKGHLGDLAKLDGTPLAIANEKSLKTKVTELSLKARWSNLNDEVLAQMQADETLCARNTAVHQGDLPWAAPENCLAEQVFSQSSGIHDGYLGCIAQTLVGGEAHSTPSGTGFGVQSYNGVAMGSKCELMADGEDTAVAETDTGNDEELSDEEKEKRLEEIGIEINKLREAQARGEVSDFDYNRRVVSLLCEARSLRGGACAGGSGSGGPQGTVPPPPAPQPEPAEDSGPRPLPGGVDRFSLDGGEKSFVNCTATGGGHPDCEADEIATAGIEMWEQDEFCRSDVGCTENTIGLIKQDIDWIKANIEDPTERARQLGMRERQLHLYEGTLRNLRNAANLGCSDPYSCDSACSAIGRQVAGVAQCSSDFVKELLKAAGFGDSGTIPQQPWRDPRVEHPDPYASEGSSDLAACFPGANVAPAGGTWQANGACGLVLCEGPASNSECCGADPRAAGFASQNPQCPLVHCDPNQPCECLGEAGIPGGMGGGPVAPY